MATYCIIEVSLPSGEWLSLSIPSRPALMPALKPSLWEWSDWSVLLSASCSECSRLPCRCVEDTCYCAWKGEACCNRNTCTVINRYFFIAIGCNITDFWELLAIQLVTSARTGNSHHCSSLPPLWGTSLHSISVFSDPNFRSIFLLYVGRDFTENVLEKTCDR
jgi:hypothetical protein